MSGKKIDTIHEMEREYNEGSSRFKNGSNGPYNEKRFMTAQSKSSVQVKERKSSLIQKKRRLQDEVADLRDKLDRKRAESISRSRLGTSRRSISRTRGSDQKGFRNVKKQKNSKMLIDEIKK